MPRFVTTRAPGPAWDSAKPIREQSGWDAHAAFMDALADERFVAFGGPAGNENQVVHAIDAADEATIRDRLGQDPWETADVLRTLTVKPWTIWLGGDERIDSEHSAPFYLVAYAPGPHWDHSKPRREQAGWDAHAAFIDALTEHGTVVLGGPLDDKRALLVVRGDREPAVRAQLDRDPWINQVLIIERLERWSLWLTPSAIRSTT